MGMKEEIIVGVDKSTLQMYEMMGMKNKYKLVRCEKCAHYLQDSKGISYCYRNRSYGWEDDDYCSKGENK